MKDADIRESLWAHLDALYAPEPEAKLFDEFGVCEGRVRIDLAVVSSSLHGFEIKSDQDTLGRLDGQQRLYSKVFDQVTIVTHGAHMAHVFERVPAWWGVTQALGIGPAFVRGSLAKGSGIVRFIDRRPALPNPAQDPLALVKLLWRDEVIALLERRGLDRGVRSKARKHAWKRAATSIALPELRADVCASLKQREWRPLAPRRAAALTPAPESSR